MNKIAVTFSPCTYRLICVNEITGQQRTTPRTLPKIFYDFLFFVKQLSSSQEPQRSCICFYKPQKSISFSLENKYYCFYTVVANLTMIAIVNFRSSISLEKVLQILTRISWEKKVKNVLSFPLSLQSLNRFWKPDKPTSSSSGVDLVGECRGRPPPPSRRDYLRLSNTIGILHKKNFVVYWC